MPNSTITTTSESERINWIRLIRSENVGSVTFFNLIKAFGSASLAIENVTEIALQGGLKKPIKICPESEVKKELENCQKINAKIICFFDPQYPKQLKEIYDPPPVLTTLGNTQLLNQDIIAIVGPRNASLNGCRFAQKIAGELSLTKLIIASGMARGIDTAAHLGSLTGGTIAVIAGGIDNIYPPENKQLYQQIIKHGLIISENPFGSAPKSGNFPQRNRIISGLSLGVLVVEATLKSGTLITARFASEQNREIFAVPGSPFDPRCHGTNLLIKQGAKLVENVDDVLEELRPSRNQINPEPQSTYQELPDLTSDSKLPDDKLVNDARKLILQKLNYSGTAGDEIISTLQIPTRIINIALVQLELSKKIENKNGKFFLCGQ